MSSIFSRRKAQCRGDGDIRFFLGVDEDSDTCNKVFFSSPWKLPHMANAVWSFCESIWGDGRPSLTPPCPGSCESQSVIKTLNGSSERRMAVIWVCRVNPRTWGWRLLCPLWIYSLRNHPWCRNAKSSTRLDWDYLICVALASQLSLYLLALYQASMWSIVILHPHGRPIPLTRNLPYHPIHSFILELYSILPPFLHPETASKPQRRAWTFSPKRKL